MKGHVPGTGDRVMNKVLPEIAVLGERTKMKID